MKQDKRKFFAIASLLIASCQASVPSRPSVQTNQVDSRLEDFLMDLVLDDLKFYLVANNETVIRIPEVTTGFEYDVIGIPFTGWFNTSSGSFTNPASIRRQGEVNISHLRDRVITSMTVSFSQLQVSFPEYAASVVGITESGAMDVTVQQNAVFIEVTVMYIPHCIVSISRLEFSRMSGIIVNMSGLSFLSNLEGQIIAWILQSYKTTFTRVVENVVKNKIQDQLAKTKICKFKKSY